MAPSRVDYLADFDSATAMLRALAAFLHGRDFANLGLTSALKPLVIGANLLPTRLRQEVYKLGACSRPIRTCSCTRCTIPIRTD